MDTQLSHLFMTHLPAVHSELSAEPYISQILNLKIPEEQRVIFDGTTCEDFYDGCCETSSQVLL